MSVQRILVGVDGSGGGRHALEWTVPLAQSLGAEVLVVRIYDPVTELLGTAERLEFDELRARAGERLESWAAPLAERDVTYRTMVVDADSAHEGIVDTALAERADMIIIGNLGLTGWRERIIGSVAARVLKNSTVPVVVVPQPKPED
jgi:nucleotide-binding universal stress UspA family protein